MTPNQNEAQLIKESLKVLDAHDRKKIDALARDCQWADGNFLKNLVVAVGPKRCKAANEVIAERQ